MDVAVIAGIIMIISVVVMLVMGVPIGISIGMSSALAMITILPFGPGIVTCAQKMFTGVNSFSLLAIPFFILAGNIMNNGGIAGRVGRVGALALAHLRAQNHGHCAFGHAVDEQGTLIAVHRVQQDGLALRGQHR